MSRETDEPFALTLVEPARSAEIAADEASDEARRRRLLGGPSVREYAGDADWVPSFGLPDAIGSMTIISGSNKW